MTRGIDFGGQSGARANPRAPRVPSPREFTFRPLTSLANPRAAVRGNPGNANDICDWLGQNEGRITHVAPTSTNRMRVLSSSAAIGTATRLVDRNSSEFYTLADAPGWIVLDFMNHTVRLSGIHWQVISSTLYLPLIIPVWGTNYLSLFTAAEAGNTANWERVGTFRSNQPDGIVAFGWGYTAIPMAKRYRYLRFDGHPDNPGGNNCFINEIMCYGTVRRFTA